MGRFIKNPRIDPGALSLEIPQVTTAQRPTGQNGQIIYNTSTSTYQTYIGAQWYNVSTAAGTKTITIDRFQGDGTTVTFGGGSGNTLDGSTAANLSFSVNDSSDILVFIGGIYQTPETNYTVSGNQITFGSPPDSLDGNGNVNVITIIHGINKLGE
jgi:hypothetical protein